MPDVSYINLAANIFTIVMFVVTAVYVGRSRGSEISTDNVIQLLKEELQAVRDRANRLHNNLDEERKERQDLETKLVKLESLPDMTKLLEEMKAQREWAQENTTESMRAVSRMFEKHEDRAQQRHELIVESFTQLTQGLSEINKSLRAINGRE